MGKRERERYRGERGREIQRRERERYRGEREGETRRKREGEKEKNYKHKKIHGILSLHEFYRCIYCSCIYCSYYFSILRYFQRKVPPLYLPKSCYSSTLSPKELLFLHFTSQRPNCVFIVFLCSPY